jgi:hypothetical protein
MIDNNEITVTNCAVCTRFTDKCNNEGSLETCFFSVVVVTKKRSPLDIAIYTRINGEISKKTQASGLIKNKRKKLGINGIERKDKPGCFFGRNEVRIMISIARGNMRSAEVRSAENMLRKTKKTTSIFVDGLPGV